MARIAISYRRSDTQAMSGRIFDRLVDRYGDDSVFMDIDKIPLGMDFRDHIREVLENADIVLAIVGPDWVGHRGNGTTRLADEVDPVRFEIETALTRKIPVIPVLVGDAEMPKPNELPESLKPFVYRNAATIDTGRDFRVHMDRLIGAIDQIIARIRERSAGPAPAPSAPRQPPPKTATGDPPRPVSAAANAAPAVSGASLRAWADVLIHIAAPTLIMIFLFFALGIGKAASTDSTMLIALSAICLSLSLLAGFSIYRRRHYLGGRAAAIGSAIAVIGLAVIIVTTDSRIASARTSVICGSTDLHGIVHNP